MADRPHPSSIAGGPYDGTTFSYIPGDTLTIDPSLKLHREWTDKIDPITYEVHQYDVGGITPGSFCPNARDAFDEGILIPPVKIVERGELRRDIEGVYLRASRKPYLVALDLRAQIAGNNTAKKRILGLIRRYGPEVVKGVMRKIIDNAEQAFLQKLAKLPDGVWRERSYVEVAYVGDRKTYQVMLNMQKRGDRLVFDNAGTAPQVGAINTTYSGWRGSAMP